MHSVCNLLSSPIEEDGFKEDLGGWKDNHQMRDSESRQWPPLCKLQLQSGCNQIAVSILGQLLVVHVQLCR